MQHAMRKVSVREGRAVEWGSRGHTLCFACSRKRDFFFVVIAASRHQDAKHQQRLTERSPRSSSSMAALFFLSADEDSWGVGGAAVSAQHAVHGSGALPPVREMGQDE
jgi:hypothetical protein